MSTSNVAVVTGAAQGIGRATAVELDRRGWSLVLLDLQAVDVSGFRDAMAFTGDLTDGAFLQDAHRAALSRFGGVTALVNNAGRSMIAPATETSADAVRAVLEVNLVAPFVLSTLFGGSMLAQGRGSIVNIASVAGLQGVAERSAYNASKHAIIGLTRTLAVEWGAKGVRVNAVAPGWVKTEMDHADQAGGSYNDRDIVEHVPMGRFARPDDIASAVSWLCDGNQSGFVNGVVLPVDGGWTADGSWQSLRLRQR
jgi:NAD(P)-dependent dehydrogenase (short-subunit alcohol dehydrogenase family)